MITMNMVQKASLRIRGLTVFPPVCFLCVTGGTLGGLVCGVMPVFGVSRFDEPPPLLPPPELVFPGDLEVGAVRCLCGCCTVDGIGCWMGCWMGL